MERKTLIFVIVCLLFGATLGWIVRGCTFHCDTKVVTKTDTLVVNKYVTYEGWQLPSVELDYHLPEIPELVYITEYKTEVRNDTTYIVLPRVSKYLKKDGVEVWYSGVDPTIDKMVIESQIREITKVVEQPFKKNEISLYGAIGYRYGLCSPVGVRYSYSPARWFSLETDIGYDFIGRRFNVMETARLRIFSF